MGRVPPCGTPEQFSLGRRAALAGPEFVKISHTTTYRFPSGVATSGARSTYPIYGENRLLNHGYPGIVAGKNGFTTEAKRTFWTAATRNGHTLIVSMFRIVGPTEPAAATLLNWGFRHESALRPIGTLVGPATASATSNSTTGSTDRPSAGPTDAATAAVNSLTATPGTSIAGWVILAIVGLGIAAVVVWRRIVVSRHRSDDRPPASRDDQHAADAASPQRRSDALL